VRGAAYAGVLDAMPAHIQIVSVAGTSAGAIVAAFVAKGYRGEQLKRILADPSLTKLLSEADVARWQRAERSWKAASPLFEKLLKEGTSFGTLWKLKGWAQQHAQSLRDLAEIWEERGIYKTERLRAWLDDHLGDLTFAQVEPLGHVQSLRIVASDVSGRQFRVFGATESDGNTRVAKAVHASASIPLFFTPLADDRDILVDGGMLSNYPSFLFARSEYPTIGFRLVDMVPPKHIRSTLDFLRSLIHTVTEAHDRLRDVPDYFQSFEIEVPEDIPSTKFDLDAADLDRLYNRGRSTGLSVPWDTCSAPGKVVPYWDPKPQRALQLALTEANKLYERYSDREFWVDKLIHDATFTARVKQDWSVEYERKGTMEVFGARSLLMGRSTVIEPATLKETSIAKVVHTCVEVKGAVETGLIHIPAENASERKGFLLFYIPPIAAGKPRTFRTSFEIHEEFAGSVAKDLPATISYGVRQIAIDHQLNLTFRILVDVDLPRLSISPQFPGTFAEKGTEFDARDSRTYHVYECPIQAPVVFHPAFDVTVEKHNPKPQGP
jgi:NTE family protein